MCVVQTSVAPTLVLLLTRRLSSFIFLLFTAWIGSMAFGMNFLFGPVTSALCERFGCRLVGACGALLAALGLLLTSFVDKLYLIALTYSVMWGIGSSLNYAPTMIILGEYLSRIICRPATPRKYAFLSCDHLDFESAVTAQNDRSKTVIELVVKLPRYL